MLGWFCGCGVWFWLCVGVFLFRFGGGRFLGFFFNFNWISLLGPFLSDISDKKSQKICLSDPASYFSSHLSDLVV